MSKYDNIFIFWTQIFRLLFFRHLLRITIFLNGNFSWQRFLFFRFLLLLRLLNFRFMLKNFFFMILFPFLFWILNQKVMLNFSFNNEISRYIFEHTIQKASILNYIVLDLFKLIFLLNIYLSYLLFIIVNYIEDYAFLL